MSDTHEDPIDPETELREDIELLAELLTHEFRAIERATERVRESSDLARKLDDDDLVASLTRLRLARAVDDFTSIYLDLKDEEAETAREMLEELGGDEDFDDEDDEFDDDEFEDEEFDDDDDDFEDLDDEDEDADDEDSEDDFGGDLGDGTPRSRHR